MTRWTSIDLFSPPQSNYIELLLYTIHILTQCSFVQDIDVRTNPALAKGNTEKVRPRHLVAIHLQRPYFLTAMFLPIVFVISQGSRYNALPVALLRTMLQSTTCRRRPGRSKQSHRKRLCTLFLICHHYRQVYLRRKLPKLVTHLPLVSCIHIHHCHDHL